MQKMTLNLKFTVSQTRDAAMRQAGLNPSVMAMKPGCRVERNRMLAHKNGYQKHKARNVD